MDYSLSKYLKRQTICFVDADLGGDAVLIVLCETVVPVTMSGVACVRRVRGEWRRHN